LLVVPTALITGPLPHAADTALALKAAGFEVVAADPDVGELPLHVGPFDCYVQLPLDPPWAQDDALTWARSTVDAVLRRFDAAARVAPMLAPGARIIVIGDPTDGRPVFDMDGVRLLIKEIVAGHGGHDVRVTVTDGLRSPEEIIAAARPSRSTWTAYRTIEPGLAFCDWRNEVICQSSLEP
jgi:hypothetical protein